MGYRPLPFLAFSACLLLAPAAQAQDAETIAICDVQRALAAEIMESRQEGVPMSRLMQIKDHYADQGHALAGVMETLVPFAYDRPIMEGQEEKEEAIAAFSYAVQQACFATAAKSQ